MEKENLLHLLQNRQFKQVREILENMNEVDMAEILSDFEDKEMAFVFRLIPKDKAAEVFANLEDAMQSYLVEIFSEKELEDLLDDLYMDDTVDMLEDLPANLVSRVLDIVSPSKRTQLNTLLQYEGDSAGSIMTTEYVSLRSFMTVAETMAHIKRTGIKKENIYTCYVTEKRKLIGIVSAKNLLTSEDDMLIENLMEKEIISVNTHTDQEEVSDLFAKYDLIALPVLDSDNHLVGIVTFDDAIDVMVEEDTEDISKMAAVNPSEKPYFETSVWKHAKNRFTWLLVLMLSATIAGGIIQYYHSVIVGTDTILNPGTMFALLTTFYPMLMNTGGSGGAQASALIIRGIALKEIAFKDLPKAVFMEFRIALIVGSILAVANGVRIFVIHHDLTLAIVIALSLIGTMIVSKITGCSLPLIAKKIKMDPAVMAAPLITTIVDALALVIFFNVAIWLMR